MTQQVATHHPAGINMYVPRMQYASNVADGGEVEVSLGSPAASDDNAIHTGLDGDALNTVYATGFTTSGIGADCEGDAVYGRTVLLSPSGDPGATGLTVRFRGEDYLGQPMVEDLTVANGSSADVEGVKAFWRVLSLEVTVAATNAITADAGWGTKLGLPYKIEQFLGGREGSIITRPAGVIRSAAAAVTVSGTNAYSTTAPITGYIIGAEAEITTATTTNPAVMDAVVGGSGAAALDMIVPVGAAGVVSKVNIAKASWIAVTQGDTVVLTSNGGPGAGVAEFSVLFSYGLPDLTDPVDTDPQTATTGDPRGLYLPQLTPNASREYRIRYIADRTDNGTNGGLHGIAHYTA